MRAPFQLLPFESGTLLCIRLRVTNARWVATFVLLCFFSPLEMVAEEPADAFLRQLRRRGYHDTVLEYLEWAQASSLVKEQWRKRIPYHRGVALIEQADKLPPKQAAQKTSEAESLLAKFMAENGELPEAKISSFWLGQIMSGKARRKLKTVTDDMTGAAKRKIRNPAAETFKEAQDEFTKSGEFFRTELTAMKKLAPSQLDVEKRDQFRAYYLEAELNRALIDYELAETVATSKTKYADQLKTAKKSLGEFAVQQSKRMAGVQAKIYQGRCFEDLNEVEDALAIYQEIIDELALPELFSSQAVLRSMACSVSKKSNPKNAVETGLNWLKQRSPDTTSQPAQAVRLEVARQIQAALPGLEPNEQRKLKTEAKQLLADAARAGGSGTAEAMQMLASLGFDPVVSSAGRSNKQTSFTAAKAAAEQLRAALRPLLDTEALLQENLERSSVPENRVEIETQIAETRQELEDKRVEVIQAYRDAIAVADEQDDQDAVSEAVYICGYLYYTADSYHEAAVMGQYAARVAPNMPSAKAAANIALASYMKLYQDAGADSSIEAKFLVQIARFIVATWPGSKEAQESLTLLISFMVNEGNIQQAESYLQQIPSESTQRSEAELRTGQAIWHAYLQKVQAAKGKPVSNGEEMKLRAQTLLREGLQRARGTTVTAATARGALALAQVHLDLNAPNEASLLLNDPEWGPLTLIANKDAVAKSPGFLEQTYKSALRAQIGSLTQPEVDAKAAVGEAMATMQALSNAVGDTPESKRRLTATYINLAKDLQRQLQLSTAETRSDIAEAFESFLNQVAAGSNDVSVLNWVAETYFRLAEGEQDVSPRSSKAQEYFGRSADVFGDILARREQGSLELADSMVIQVQVRSAEANLRATRYQQAFDLYEKVLSAKNTMLNVQVDAASALQEAAARGNPDLFNKAVKGDRPQDDKNVIWGWEKISKVTAAQMRKSPEAREKYGKIFFEARYNIASSRLRQGLATADDSRSALLGSAKRAIRITDNLYPDLGGDAWQRKFDRLMKEVQESLGEEPTGLSMP